PAARRTPSGCRITARLPDDERFRSVPGPRGVRRPRARRSPWRSTLRARTRTYASSGSLLPAGQHRVYYGAGTALGVRCGETTLSGAIMLIERIWAANSFRNFHYLVACPESGEALAIDPLEWP